MGIVPDGPRRARPTRALPRPKAIAAAVGVAAAVLGATAWATLAGGAGAQGSWSSLIGFGFYQLWMATLAAWAQAIAFTAAVGGGMLAWQGDDSKEGRWSSRSAPGWSWPAATLRGPPTGCSAGFSGS